MKTLDRTENAGPEHGPDIASIVDVQGSPDARRIPIDKVGIKGIRHPVRVLDRSTGRQETVAIFNMYVDLPQDFKGTHMSRFVQVLENHEYEITVSTFQRMLREMVELLEARSGPHRDDVPLLRAEGRPGEPREQPDGLRRHPDRGDPPGRGADEHPHRRTGDEPLPVLEGHLGLRRAQPALARDRARPHPGPGMDRGAHRHRGARGVVPALRSAQAPPTRSSSPSTPTTTPSSSRTWSAMSPGDWTRTRASRAIPSRPRTSSRSTTTRPTRASTVRA